MSNVTTEQKDVFLELAARYSAPVHALVARGRNAQILIQSRSEAATLDEFANNIVAMVLHDHQDYAGADEGIHANAELVVHIVADLLHEHGYAIR